MSGLRALPCFDMTTLELKDSYNADAPTYAASDTVRATYDSGSVSRCVELH